MKLQRLKLTLVFAVMLLAYPTSVNAQELTPARYDELMKEIGYRGDEPWRQIPWKTSLLDAQQTAAQVNKPIFIWAMDGHPLGCT